MAKIKRKIIYLRRIIQILSFCFIILGGLLGIKKQQIKFFPPLQAPKEFKDSILHYSSYPQAFDAFLPIKSCRYARNIGTFRACFMHFLSENISWVTPLRIVLPHILMFFILSIFFGRLLCGWVCPLGFISDILNIIRKNLKLPHLVLSEKFKRLFKNISYVLFAGIIIFSIISAIPVFPWSLRKQVYLSVCQMCPSRFIFPYLGKWPIVHSFLPVGYGIFTVISIGFTLIFVSSFFVKRFWCRICPSGLLLSFFNRGGMITKEKEVLKCTRCGICVNICPLQNENVYLEKNRKNVDYPNCIHCFSCINFCPEDNCLKVKFLGIQIFKSKFK